MTITTLATAISKIQYQRDIIKSGAQASLNTTWATSSMPSSGSYDTTLNGVALTSPVTGQIPFPTPAATAYLARAQFQHSVSNQLCDIMIQDRLWHNGGIDATLNTAQNITSPAWPARDIAGSTNGDGVLLAVEISATMGAATPTISISYTNSSGTSGRTSTNIAATLSAQASNKVTEMSLQAGDTGVRSVQSVTLSTSWISGTMNIVAYRPLAMFQLPITGNTPAIDVVTGGFPMLYSGSVPYLSYRCGSAPVICGKILFSDG